MDLNEVLSFVKKNNKSKNKQRLEKIKMLIETRRNGTEISSQIPHYRLYCCDVEMLMLTKNDV